MLIETLKTLAKKVRSSFFISLILAGLVFSASMIKANVPIELNFNSETKSYESNENFSWGVLAINSNKATYLPNETAQLEFAVLDEKGAMVCDAELNLTVTKPDGQTQLLSTKTGEIKINQAVCRSYALTEIPDYEANYLLTNPGEYQLSLEAITKNGTHLITSKIEVKEKTNFTVERQATTRVYPINKYPVKILVTPQEDFKGTIEEPIPENFEIFAINHGGQKLNDTISWEVAWQAGQTYELEYTFDTPDKNPAFYTTGPLKIGDDFSENRSWQLAVDAVLTYVGGVEISGSSNGGGGWVELTDQIGADTRDANMSVSYKIMGATPDSSIPVNSAITTAFGSTSVVHIWRNVDQNNPIDVTTTTATAANSAVFDSPAITPVTTGAQVLSIGLSTAAANAGDTAITAPSGYGNQVDNNGNGSTASVQAGIASKAWSGSGAENPAAWTNITSTTSDSWVAATVALRPNGTLTYVGGAENSGTTPYSIDISGLSPQEGDIVIVVTGWSHTTNGDPGVRLYDLDLSGLSMQEGDLVIVATGWSHTTDGDPGVYTNGYSELTDQIGADTRDANLSINYKIMGATPDSGVTCYGSGYQSPVYGDLCLAHVWRGADPTTPIDVTTTTATAANSAVFDSPAITPVTAGAQVLSIGLSTAAASAGDTTITAPTDYINQLDHNSDGTTHSIQAGIASKAWSGSGAENPTAWTNITSTTSDSWVAATVAIRPFIETGIDISGTANGNDGATVRVAINGSVQAQTGTISSSAWTISGVTAPTADDIITVWVDNVADSNESTAVTKYSSGDITGMVLDTNVTSIGSDQNTSLTVTNLNAYDCTEDEDIMYQAASSTLLVEGNSCAGSTTNSYSAEELEILSGDLLTIGGTETLTTYDLTITGTLTSTGNATYNIAHNWANTGTFTSDTSTVNLTGADSSTQTISGSTSFYNLAVSTASNSAGKTITHTAGTTQTVTGTWTVTGYSGKVITLGSSTTSAWTINPTTASVTYADVSYSTNSGTSFCATYTTNSGNNTNWTIVSDASCPSATSSAYSFQRKTWYDGTRYWRSFQDTTDNRIEFEYSTDGSSWTENTSARIDVDTDDFSIYGDSTNTYIAYKTSAVTNEDNLLQSNLVGFWKLDENSTGTCSGGLDSCDASGNNYHGDWINNATNTTGKFNNAITVDGTGDYVQISESDSDGALDHSNGDTITVSAWIKPTALPPADNWDTYVGKNGADDGWFLQLDETGNIEWFIWNNPGWAAFVTTTQPITVGEWNQVTISQTLGTDSSLKIYVNGIEQPFSQSGTANLYPDLNNYAVSIGGNSDGSEEANGAIDDVRIYSSILTAKQVEQLANPGYDIEVRKASSYPGTSFSWSNPEISFNGSASTDYYQYPTITQDTNSKIWTTAHYYSTGTITDLQTVADNDDGADVVGSSNFYSVGTPDSWDTGTQIAVGGVDYSNNNITTGFRWQEIPIPQKATISSASFDLYDSWGGNYGTEMKTNVYGAKVSNLSSFSAINLPRNITKTTASVAWDSTSDGSPHTWFSTSTGFVPPAITSIIQEIVDQPDWNKNNSLGILIDDDGSTTAWWWAAYTHENGASTAPKFSASYTASQIQAIQTTNANDITSWNSLTILDQSTNTNKYGLIVPKNSGAMAAIWLDGSTIESKNFDGNNWDTTTTVATGNTGLTKSISAVADSSGNIHLVYINSSNQTIYQEYTSSWQTAVTLDSNSGNEYPTIAYNTTNNNLFAFWVRGGNILYKEGTSDYTSGNWDAVATDWQTTGSNIYLTSNYSGNNNIFVEWTNGSTINWSKLPLTESLISAYSFQRKTWHDGTRYWRAYNDPDNERINFEYSSDGTSWTEDTSARISTNTNDFSIEADSSNAYISYKTGAVTNEDNLLTDSSLIAYYKMNEASWNGSANEVTDSSSSLNHGNRVGNATTTSTAKFDRAGSFDGSGSYVSMGDKTAHDINPPLSITAWIYLTELPSTKGSDSEIVSKYGGAGNRQYTLSIGTDDYLYFWKHNGTTGQYAFNNGYQFTSSDLNVWRHVGITIDSSGVTKMYVDGTNVDSGQLIDNTFYTGASTNFLIGARAIPSNYFKGNIDEVRLYNRDLDPVEIASLAQPGYDIETRKATSYPGTSFSWSDPTIPFNGSSETDAYSYAGITKDSNSKIWNIATNYNSPNYLTKTIQATSANDISSWESANTLNTSTQANQYGTIVPRTSGNIMAVWMDGTTIESKNYNGSAWDGSPTTIDTGLTGLADTFSAVADSSGNVYLSFVDDETTDQISHTKFNGTSWSSAVLVANSADTNDSYPTLTIDTTNSDLYTFWIDTATSDIYYSVCDITTNCDTAVEWSTETSWQTTGSNTYLTSNYSGAGQVFAEWVNGETIDWDKLNINSTPSTPSLDTPSDTATNQILSTVLKTTTTDTDSDYLRYKIELCEDSGMSSNCQTFDQTSSQTGWSGQDAQTSTAYASGTQATYTLQTPLNLNTTYYWRSYAIDPAGTNSWSSTQGSPYSFTTAAAPVISSVSVNSGEAITLTEGTTTTISWVGTVTDADGHTNISSAQGVIYRSGVTNAETCTPNNENCYVAASCNLSGCAGNSCTATCSVNLEFFANPTDSASLYPTEYWRGWIEATDANSNTGEGWSVATTTDVESLAAMSVTSSIAYGPLLPGDDTGSSNQTTVVTNTGNTILDLEISGDNFCTDYPTCAGYQIPVGYQEYNTSTFTYGLGNALSSTPTSAQINLAKSTLNPANSTTNIYWGLGIPTPKEDGAYSGANTLTAVDGD